MTKQKQTKRRARTQYEVECAQRAKALQRASGLSQEKIGEILGMQQGVVSQYLNGPIAINMKFLARFAKAINKSPADIDVDGKLFDALDSDEQQLIDLFRSADEQERRELLRIAEGYLSKR